MYQATETIKNIFNKAILINDKNKKIYFSLYKQASPEVKSILSFASIDKNVIKVFIGQLETNLLILKGDLKQDLVKGELLKRDIKPSSFRFIEGGKTSELIRELSIIIETLNSVKEKDVYWNLDNIKEVDRLLFHFEKIKASKDVIEDKRREIEKEEKAIESSKLNINKHLLSAIKEIENYYVQIVSTNYQVEIPEEDQEMLYIEMYKIDLNQTTIEDFFKDFNEKRSKRVFDCLNKSRFLISSIIEETVELYDLSPNFIKDLVSHIKAKELIEDHLIITDNDNSYIEDPYSFEEFYEEESFSNYII